MSGSNPRLNETNAIFIVKNEKRMPKAKVETITIRIAEKSTIVMPQNR
jgi:hypothetical protein